MQVGDNKNVIGSFFLAIFICYFTSVPLENVWAHKGETHIAEPSKTAPYINQDTQLAKINEFYLSDVKPIFRRSCFDCHSSSTIYPWYSDLPGAKQLIRVDVEEAKTHLDMTADFPFKSHSTPTEDLKSLIDSIKNGSMPPLRYRLLHWSANLSESEREIIIKWAEDSLSHLEVR